ncbi:MAG: response regulator [Bacteroidetes bacterium]|nr:response regulator [Bacteroidota bacterium]
MNPISIYIVEDELLISASLKSQLQQFGYEISGSSIRGESCLEEIAELSKQGKEPEIVLMDIHLRGEMDGIETAKLINDKFNCAIIFLTGQSSKEIYDRSFKIKPFGYLLKPIDMEQTKMTIEIASYQRNLEIENTLYQKDLEALLEKRSQENKELMAMYQTIVDNSLMGLTIMQDDKFVFANNRTAKIFGYPLEEFLAFNSTDILNLLHPDDKIKMTALSEARLNGDELRQNTRIRIYTRDKELKQIETHIKAVQFKGKPALHQTFLDITDFYTGS